MRSCSTEIHRARPLLGTFVEMRVRGLAAPAAHAAIDRAYAAVARVHECMSPHEPAGDIARLNREAHHRPVRVDPWTYRVLAGAQLLSVFSSGVFDLTRTADRGKLLRTTPGDWRDILLLPDWRVRFRRPLRVDLGGIAKGFAVDCAVEVLRAAGASAGVVNAGGDLRVFGSAPERIHVRHPARLSEFVPVAELVEEAMATSANYLDAPAMGRLRPPFGRRLWLGRGSVSVRAPSCMLADALCKVVAADGPRRTAQLLEACGASVFVLSPRGRIWLEEFPHATA